MNYFIEALKKYAVFSGRSRRKEYWWFVLANMIICVILELLCIKLEEIGVAILCIYALALLLPGLAVTIRRMHDIGKSGWWMLINLIPIIGGIWFLVLTLMDSQPGENKYGACPK